MDSQMQDYVEYLNWVGDGDVNPTLVHEFNLSEFVEVKKHKKVIKYSREVKDTGRATLFCFSDECIMGFWIPNTLIIVKNKKNIHVEPWFTINPVSIV